MPQKPRSPFVIHMWDSDMYHRWAPRPVQVAEAAPRKANHTANPGDPASPTTNDANATNAGIGVQPGNTEHARRFAARRQQPRRQRRPTPDNSDRQRQQ